MFRRFIRKFSNVLSKSEMNSRQRYFTNPKAENYELIENINASEEQVKQYIGRLVSDIESNIPANKRNAGDGLYLGTAGISYMFYHLSRIPALSSEKELFLTKAHQYLKPALNLFEQSQQNKKELPSFILGPCGVFALASVLYHVTGDEVQSHNYKNLYHQIAAYCKNPNFLNCGSDELFVGRAGYIMGSLWLSKETNTPLPKDDLFELCKTMIQSGRDYSIRHQSPCPLMYSYYQVEYLGAAHGLSTILQSILSVPGYLEENPGDQADIKRSVDYLLSLQTEEGNFPAATDEIGYDAKLVHWCHGAGGIFYLMAKAYLTFHDQKYLKSCEKMAHLIWKKGLLKKGPGLCHGIAGNGYVFLIMYRLTGDIKYKSMAVYFYQFMITDTFQTNARTPDNPYSLYEGTAGTVCYVADLLCPDQAVFPFSDVF